MKLMKGIRIRLSQGKSVFVAYDLLPDARSDSGEGFGVALEVDEKSVVLANMSGETIEALHKAYKAVRKERRRNFRFWFHTVGMHQGIDAVLTEAIEDDQ